jgi:hypothetical protein
LFSIVFPWFFFNVQRFAVEILLRIIARGAVDFYSGKAGSISG